ncbi:ABC transporter permease [Virgisporangium aurantiacum]|uniref:ABC3 transporter permease C-terminal domain-containing protein n=1 Tax=Virgisporangium aurantiacum TaxID=175570 RepID=A0A8J4E102_9ACTN|nr:ABC transporter permease [Virgisporangium aurantiacum]GIJ58300.1 hypothetical protein Vau01_058160 [Virgisporangium aurantiacum]
MVRFIWRYLRGRLGRSVALLTGVLVATTGFVVLTGTTDTSRLVVTGVLARETSAAYDILVRPKGARTPLEAEQRLVRPNYLSGQFGGLTLDDWAKVRGVPGVDVAAPIAMIGYSTMSLPVPFDLTDAVDRSLDSQVIRIDTTFEAERGLSHGVADPGFVYVTKNKVLFLDLVDDAAPLDRPSRYTDGREYPPVDCGGDIAAFPPREVLPDGRTVPVCGIGPEVALTTHPGAGETRSELTGSWLFTAHLRPDGRFETDAHHRPGTPVAAPVDRLVVERYVSVPYLLAAVDPDAEERLVGLRGATVAGRALTGGDRTADAPATANMAAQRVFPVIATSRSYIDMQGNTRYSRLPPQQVAGLRSAALLPALTGPRGTPAGEWRGDVDDRYLESVTDRFASDAWGDLLETVVQPGPTTYERLPDGTLRATTVPQTPNIFGAGRFAGLAEPWLTADPWFRPLKRIELVDSTSGGAIQSWKPVGVFDPEKLAGFSDVSRVPLETYEPPAAAGADPASRGALGDRPLLPGGNPGGYLAAPPLLLTSLSVVPTLFERHPAQAAAPISAIRVRVAGVSGYSEVNAERVRAAAEEIARRTGLDVDITLGSSPAPQTVELAAGAFGRPVLRVGEGWSSIGVASRIVRATDRKSLILFVLVLVVCALFLGNAVSAAVRDRRTELAVLSCLGWPARRIAASILGEVAVIGTVAGLAAVGLAAPLAALMDIRVTIGQAVLAVPIALALALVAGVVPAVGAARTHPATALHSVRGPVRGTARRRRHARTVFGLSLVNLTRVPGRTVLGAGALAIGVAALTVLAAVTFAFQGTVVGTLLGDAVSVTVRGVDQLAAVATVLLGVVAVADVMYLNVRDRAAELATLRASGWTEAALVRLIAYEGGLLGLLGAVTGAGTGLAVAAWLVGEVPARLVAVAVGSAAVGVLIAGVAAIVPTVLLRRLPAARLLAEE